MGNLSSLAPPFQLQIWPAQGGRVGVVVPTLTKQLRPAGSTQVTMVTNSPAVSALDLQDPAPPARRSAPPPSALLCSSHHVPKPRGEQEAIEHAQDPVQSA